MFDSSHHVTISLDPQQFAALVELLTVDRSDQAALDAVLAKTKALLNQAHDISTEPPKEQS